VRSSSTFGHFIIFGDPADSGSVGSSRAAQDFARLATVACSCTMVLRQTASAERVGHLQKKCALQGTTPLSSQGLHGLVDAAEIAIACGRRGVDYCPPLRKYHSQIDRQLLKPFLT
jgi:hypothetical protein